jgi:hypothetical protein
MNRIPKNRNIAFRINKISEIKYFENLSLFKVNAVENAKRFKSILNRTDIKIVWLYYDCVSKCVEFDKELLDYDGKILNPNEYYTKYDMNYCIIHIDFREEKLKRILNK